MPTKLQFLNNQEAIERMDELAMRQIDFFVCYQLSSNESYCVAHDTIDKICFALFFQRKRDDTELKNIPFNDIVWNCCPPTASDYKAKMEALSTANSARKQLSC